MKKLIGVYHNQHQHWVGDGFPVRNLFSYDRLGQAISPFLLLDYVAPYHFEPTTIQRGIGSHPHRGFETLVMAYNGEVTHQDSHGGGGTIKTGDVQWMTAGAGLVHEEFHSDHFAQTGGLFEMLQLWINLPAVAKMTTPKYQAIEAAAFPQIALDTLGSQLRVIAGRFADQHGPAVSYSPINVWDVSLKSGQMQDFYIPAGHNSILVVLAGEVRVNKSDQIVDHSVVLFANETDPHIHIEALADAKFLLLTGQPLNEPIEGYGPFVMNTQAEIIEAFNDFNNGKFGQIKAEVSS